MVSVLSDQRCRLLFLRRLTASLVVVAFIFPALWADEARRPPKELLAAFASEWDEELWVPRKPGRFSRFIRLPNDAGWQRRMLVLQQLVAGGPRAHEALFKALVEGDAPERILAAQALGFLASEVPAAPLWLAAKTDPDAAVRLYAVDALGMQGGKIDTAKWKTLADGEKNRDVKQHIGYVLGRKETAVDPATVRKLLEWDAGRIDSAKVGQTAPDFELTSLTGERITLGQFRGSKPVVLVFIYGDT